MSGGGEERGARPAGGADVALALVVVLGLSLVFVLARRAEAGREGAGARTPRDEELYVTPEAARRMSLAFNGLVADWYWLRTLQYVGRKLEEYPGKINIDDLRPIGATQLGPMLERVTALDPQFMAAYEYGAVVLPAVDTEAAVRLTQKGIRENPRRWRLYHQLGYIYWQAGRYREAARAYREGAAVEGAPAWMSVMAAQMEVGGGSRDLARDIYRRMYSESGDEQVRQLALRRLMQLDSLDLTDRIKRLLEDHRARAGRCPASWREAAPALRSAGLELGEGGAPLDPAGVPYALAAGGCGVALGEGSPIPKE